MQRLAALTVGLLVLLFVGVAVETPPSVPSAGRLGAAAPYGVTFSFSPSTVTINTQTQGMVQFSGGATPFKVWLNGSAPGCNPSQQPFVTSNYSNPWNCRPNASGTYNVHLDAVDSTGTKESASATLTVQSSGGGGSGSGNGSGTNPLAGLQDFLPTLFIFAFVFLGALVALAAGVVAMEATSTNTNWSCPVIIRLDVICHSLTGLRIVALLFNCEGQRRGVWNSHSGRGTLCRKPV